MKPLTTVAHELIARVLSPGDRAIDATAGNGHDTAFLAQQVGPHGQVIAVDRQTTALEQTAARLQRFDFSQPAAQTCCETAPVVHPALFRTIGPVRLVLGNHAHLLELIEPGWIGHTAAVMFNLGYLPGGDQSIHTAAGTTILALSHSLTLLRPGGVLSLLVYPGHAAGAEELVAVELWLRELPQAEWLVSEPALSEQSNPSPANAPRLFMVERGMTS